MDAVTGLDKAKNLLKQRFGNYFVIAKAYIQRVTQGSQLKASDRVKLFDFSNKLRNCYETFSAVNRLNELTNQHTLVMIAKTIPLYLLNRWKKTAYLVTFVTEAEAEANDPVFGNLTDIVRPSLTKQSSTLSTQFYC